MGDGYFDALGDRNTSQHTSHRLRLGLLRGQHIFEEVRIVLATGPQHPTGRGSLYDQ